MKKIAALFVLLFSIFNIYCEGFSLSSYICRGGIWFYRSFITSQDGVRCPYSPSCSSFMLKRVENDGFFGFVEGLDRLDRCTRYENKSFLFEVNSEGKFIDECGKSITAVPPEYRIKNPAKGALLSAVFPGLGEFYVNNPRRGIRTMFATGIYGGAAVYCAEKYGIKNWRVMMFSAVAAVKYIVDIYGSYHEAELYNNAVYRHSLLELFKNENESIEYTVEENKVELNKERKKSETLAVCLSIIPGLGQTYAGDWKDGLNAFILNGALFGVSAWSILSGDYLTFILIEMDPLFRYYRGNFINAKKRVRDWNGGEAVAKQ